MQKQWRNDLKITHRNVELNSEALYTKEARYRKIRDEKQPGDMDRIKATKKLATVEELIKNLIDQNNGEPLFQEIEVDVETDGSSEEDGEDDEDSDSAVSISSGKLHSTNIRFYFFFFFLCVPSLLAKLSCHHLCHISSLENSGTIPEGPEPRLTTTRRHSFQKASCISSIHRWLQYWHCHRAYAILILLLSATVPLLLHRCSLIPLIYTIVPPSTVTATEVIAHRAIQPLEHRYCCRVHVHCCFLLQLAIVPLLLHSSSYQLLVH